MRLEDVLVARASSAALEVEVLSKNYNQQMHNFIAWRVVLKRIIPHLALFVTLELFSLSESVRGLCVRAKK